MSEARDPRGFGDPGVFAWGWSGADRGNMSYTSGDTAGSPGNRQRFLAGLDIDLRRLVVPRQVHGGNVEAVSEPHRGKGAVTAEDGIPDTDALITADRQLPLSVLTADCLPMIIIDPFTPAAGIVHAGWRSTASGIAARTVERMRTAFGSDPGRMRCLFGPAIRPCCYRVGEDFRGIFPRSVSGSDGELKLDLAGENRLRLAEAGVPKDNIFDSGLCTCCNGGFFSYRRQGPSCGRLLSVIMIR